MRASIETAALLCAAISAAGMLHAEGPSPAQVRKRLVAEFRPIADSILSGKDPDAAFAAAGRFLEPRPGEDPLTLRMRAAFPTGELYRLLGDPPEVMELGVDRIALLSFREAEASLAAGFPEDAMGNLRGFLQEFARQSRLDSRGEFADSTAVDPKTGRRLTELATERLREIHRMRPDLFTHSDELIASIAACLSVADFACLAEIPPRVGFYRIQSSPRRMDQENPRKLLQELESGWQPGVSRLESDRPVWRDYRWWIPLTGLASGRDLELALEMDGELSRWTWVGYSEVTSSGADRPATGP